jgi:hypothetical protein
MKYKSPISNIEWAMIISVMLIIDIVETGSSWGLDVAFGIGSIADAFIDIPVFLSWTMYLFLRAGIKPDWKKVLTTIAGFLGEEIDGGGLPLWTLDALVVFALQKADENAAKFGMIGQLASQAIKQYSQETPDIPAIPSHNNQVDLNASPEIKPEVPTHTPNESMYTSNTIDLRNQFTSPQSQKVPIGKSENTIDLQKPINISNF